MDSEKTSDFKTGAVRSADANHLDFTSLPLVGLIGVARTGSEGGTKYDRFNYMQGMPVHDTLNHCIRHIFMWLLGDRSEPHLEHASWGLLASVQQNLLDPDLSAPHLLGPGATITPVMQDYMDSRKEELAARRKAGEFADIGNWKLTDLPEIQTILEQRRKEIDRGWDEDETLCQEKEDGTCHRCGPDGPRCVGTSDVLDEWEIGNLGVTETIEPEEHRTPYVELVNRAIKQHKKETKESAERVNRIARSMNLIPDRFRVPDKENISGGRIVRGRIKCNNYSVKPGERDFEEVLIVGRPEHEYALMSSKLCNKKVLCVSQSDWDAGQPYEIDSAWGYATASAKCSRITGEVTRTEGVFAADDPLPDEDYVDFVAEGVRVYFKKSK